MKFGSLFTGIGGFDLAFENVGMECAWQVENDIACQHILKKHFKNVELYDDVKHVGKHNLEQVDIICGGFPCQDLSKGGKRKGLNARRSSLWFEFERIIAELLPQWVVIENVPGLLSSNNGDDFKAILTALDEFGYGVSWRVLDSQNFGVSQRRRRVFIVASLGNLSSIEVLFERESLPRDTTEISYKEVENKEYGNDIEGSKSSYNPTIWWDGGLVSQTLDRVLYKKQAMPEKGRFPAVLAPVWSECKICGDYWCNIHEIHVADCDCPPIDNFINLDLYPHDASLLRYITPLECERLQGFPDNWTMCDIDDVEISDMQRYKKIGNAITVNVAEWIGKRITNIEEI